MRVAPAVFWCAGAVLAGCPTAHTPLDAGRDAADPAIEAALDALADLRDAECSRVLRCALDPWDEEGRVVEPFTCSETDRAADAADIAGGALVVDVEDARDCIAAIAGPCGREAPLARTVEAWTEILGGPDSCRTAVRRPGAPPPPRPRRGIGAVCGNDAECEAGAYCELSAVCSEGHCAPRLAAGAPCEDSRQCAGDLGCRLATSECGCLDSQDCPAGSGCLGYACVPGGAVGELCGPSMPCARDAVCASDDTCRAGTTGERCVANRDCLGPLRCVLGACGALSAEGGPCEEPGDCEAFEAVCLEGVCRAMLPPGAACGPLDPCRDGECVAGACAGRPAGASCRFDECDPSAPYCVPPFGGEGVCSIDATGAYCQPAYERYGADLGCPAGFRCAHNFACEPVAMRGEACDANRPCEGGPCIDGVCGAYALPGQPCGALLCPDERVCVDDACVPDPSVTEPCAAPCEEAVCLPTGTCGWLPEGAACDGPYCRFGCRPSGVCASLQTVPGAPCFDDTHGGCDPSMDCVYRGFGLVCLPRCDE